MTPDVTGRPSPRERLLEAADQLFYEDGVCTVGIDRILKQADVARASLYTTYGSKDELLRAYLQHRSQTWRALVAEALPTRWSTPHERIIGVFQMLTEWFTAPGYHGCPFINASAEGAAEHAVGAVRDAHRTWVRELLSDLCREAGAADPDGLSAQLVLLYDGSMVGAQLDRSPAPGLAAQAAAAALLDSAVGGEASPHA